MTLRACLLAYLATAVSFIALDAVWLTVMSTRLYKPALGAMMLETPDWTAAALFYALYFVGLVAFAVRPAVAAGGGWAAATGWGALFGLVAYATYDLTNQATLRGWPWTLTLVDLAWGTFVSAVAATVGWRAAA